MPETLSQSPAIAYQILRTSPVVKVFALMDWLGTAV
jgi:hypothetical protein